MTLSAPPRVLCRLRKEKMTVDDDVTHRMGGEEGEDEAMRVLHPISGRR